MSSQNEKPLAGDDSGTTIKREPDPGALDEQALLLDEFAETVTALLKASGLKQKQLAKRIGVGEPRVSRLLKGHSNTTLSALAEIGWALGYRFELVPVPLSDRHITPAREDPPPPPWVHNLRHLVADQETATPLPEDPTAHTALVPKQPRRSVIPSTGTGDTADHSGCGSA